MALSDKIIYNVIMDNSTVFFESYTAYPRPVRLCNETRALAKKYLSGEVSGKIVENGFIEIESSRAFEKKTATEKYDYAVRKLAETAPISADAECLLTASASMGGALQHVMPVAYRGQPPFSGISHTTLGFDRVLKHGIDAVAEQIADRPAKTAKDRAYAASLLATVDSLRIWHGRYLQSLYSALKADSANSAFWSEKIRIFKNVPFAPPQTFAEGLQSLWFLFAFVRLCGNWPGIGRIDGMLGDLLENDLASGSITVERAREYIAHFFIKGAEWCKGNNLGGSGDAQHYQNLILAGKDESGKELCCTLTYLILEVLEELPISDYPTAVRLNKDSPARLIHAVAKVQSFGSGTVSVYNEDTVIAALEHAGFEDAVSFTNDGCWEVIIPGRSAFSYTAFDGLALLLDRIINPPKNGKEYADFEALYAAFLESLGNKITSIRDDSEKYCFTGGEPSAVVDIFQADCVERLRGYNERGCKYNIGAHHLGGFADIVNSLCAVKQLVYEQKKLSITELREMLLNDFEGNETMRQLILNRSSYYGNDDNAADEIAVRLLDDYAELSLPYCKNGLYSLPGISTFGRQIEWSKTRTAVPHGFKKGSVLANNMSPTPGTDSEGPTALIHSYCKPALWKMASGCAMDIKIAAKSLHGDNGITALESLIKAFLSLGGFYMQTDIADAETLRQAQLYPERFPHLSVRIAGWSARFVTLDKKWQDMIIERT